MSRKRLLKKVHESELEGIKAGLVPDCLDGAKNACNASSLELSDANLKWFDKIS